MLGIDDFLARTMDVPGARRATLVDLSSGLAVAAAGRQDLVDQHEDAAGTTDVVRTVLATPALSGSPAGDDIEEIIVCGTAGYHLLTLVNAAFDGQLLLHLLIDREMGNLALARLRVQSLVQEMTSS
ncbi:hypothetical protein GCM10023085_01670 [Actinomadura viridis]|uniref:Uncharacterized protein n=1 Tax=Actinomadura viridis TaxID=58110 RepID=A0A931DN34_9ACTN|nr:hypothetical protein [Actinomadura viridis]MBG6090987.1 hypothetical protein [Actinomadura viridis]